jgi:hypothetical protein
MKKFLVLYFLTILALNCFSQNSSWTPSTNLLYSTPITTTKVGIGTSSPSYVLHVKNNSTGWTNIVENNGCLVYSAYALSSSDGCGMHIRVNNSRSDRYALQIFDGSNYIFHAANNGKIGIGTSNPSNDISVNGTIDATKIGIGTTTPSNDLSVNGIVDATKIGIGTTCIPTGYILAVNGSIKAKEVQVSLDDWCDYVFNKDYKIKSLSEVEAYISLHKHLPDVPSESDVKTNGGINIGEMNTILLKKVEEQMLYIIELNKRIEVLENNK